MGTEGQIYIVRIILLVSFDQLDPEDQDLVDQGDEYEIALPCTCKDFSSWKKVKMVLDIFHGKVPVHVLEDFKFEVYDPNDEIVNEWDDRLDGYEE